MPRKSYVSKQPDDWYKANRFYQVYMWREFTSVTTFLTALNLFYGIAALAGSPEAWLGWIAWQKNPIMLIINVIGIAGALFNSKTWFEAMPKAIRIQKGDKFVPDRVMINASWAVFAVIFVIFIAVVAWLA